MITNKQMIEVLHTIDRMNISQLRDVIEYAKNTLELLEPDAAENSETA